jgi:phosphatidylglycerophosphatase A
MVKDKRNQQRTGRNEMRYPWWWITTWFGCGLSPIVSGTVGSLGALPFAYVMQTYGGNNLLFAASILIFVVGTWASNQYLRYTRREDDPSEIVVDEVAGQWLLLSFMPFTWHSYAVGFILFRAFDIIKPWPVCVADREIKGGFGVMFDDILAAIYPPLVYLLGFLALTCLNKQEMLHPIWEFLAGH